MYVKAKCIRKLLTQHKRKRSILQVFALYSAISDAMQACKCFFFFLGTKIYFKHCRAIKSESINKSNANTLRQAKPI